MSSKITFLGTGTCQLQPERMASSVLVQLNDLIFVYDFGRGISTRLAEIGMKQDEIQHIILSHFHPDHFSDLIPYLHAASWSQIDPRKMELNIYGPSEVKEQISKLINLRPHGEMDRDTFEINIHEINKDKFTILDHEFSFIELPPANNHGLKFEYNGKTYAFTGDSSYHDQEITFLKNVDLAVIDSGHITDEQILELAVKTQAKQIICSHLYRELDKNQMQQAADEKGYTGKITIGQDLMTINI